MNTPRISIIAGIGKNRELGAENKLLWNIPEDMQWFREKTNGHPVIMGRKTHESIGRILPNRPNIVITRDKAYQSQGAIISTSLEDAIGKAKTFDTTEIFIIGGANVYAQAIDIADTLYLTVVDAEFNADTFFPEYTHRFKTIVSERKSKDDTYSYTFLELSP
jgi:dihydrofolate reductase